jgi:hypothetical protein
MQQADTIFTEEQNPPRSRTARFLVPCFFLLALGAGNVWVGQFKYEQYDEIVKALEQKSSSINSESHISPLQRLKSTIDSPPRLLAQERKAQARRDFYQVVQFGGRVFIALGGIYFLAFLLSRLF